MIPLPDDPRDLVQEECPCQHCANLAIMAFGGENRELINAQAHCKLMPEIRLRWNRPANRLDLHNIGVHYCSGFTHMDARRTIEQEAEGKI